MKVPRVSIRLAPATGRRRYILIRIFAWPLIDENLTRTRDRYLTINTFVTATRVVTVDWRWAYMVVPWGLGYGFGDTVSARYMDPIFFWANA